jgi:hypothetical protein
MAGHKIRLGGTNETGLTFEGASEELLVVLVLPIDGYETQPEVRDSMTDSGDTPMLPALYSMAPTAGFLNSESFTCMGSVLGRVTAR